MRNEKNAGLKFQGMLLAVLSFLLAQNYVHAQQATALEKEPAATVMLPTYDSRAPKVLLPMDGR